MRINPNGQFVGKGICNNFTGNFAINGKKKIICNENIISTKMLCKDTESIENEFFATLKKVDGYEIDDDVLYLKSQKITVLTFTKIEEPIKEKKKKNK
jgi:heat shock protein HslJ